MLVTFCVALLCAVGSPRYVLHRRVTLLMVLYSPAFVPPLCSSFHIPNTVNKFLGFSYDFLKITEYLMY